MVIIQAVAHDELVADIHAFVVNRVGVLEIVWLEEQGGNAHVGGFQVPEFLHGVAHGVTCVNDVFHDDHMAAFQGMVEADELSDDIGGLGARIGGELDETDFTGDGQSLEQFGGEHEGTVEYHEKQWIHARHIMIDLIGHDLDVGFDFFLGDIEPKFLV